MHPDQDVAEDEGNHLAVTARLDGRTWMVDVGLGNALHEPLPLEPGRYRQGPFDYRLDPAPTVPGGWRFTQSPIMRSFACMDFRPAPARPEDFTAKHFGLRPDDLDDAAAAALWERVRTTGQSDRTGRQPGRRATANIRR